MSIGMKRNYLTPMIRIQAIETEDGILEMSLQSLPVFDENNPNTSDGSQIGNGSEILGNQHSVWDEEE